MSNYSVKPEDILSENGNYAEINGKSFRKGSIAAFLKNIEILEDPKILSENKEEALSQIKELALAIIETGLYKHVKFNNPKIQSILDEIYKSNK